VCRLTKTWCPASRLCVYACVLRARPWKYLPQTRQPYTFEVGQRHGAELLKVKVQALPQANTIREERGRQARHVS